MEKFYTYSFDDFLADDSFIRYIRGDDEGSVSTWVTYLASSPQNISVFHQARSTVVVMLSIVPIEDTSHSKLTVWDNIEREILQTENLNRRKLRTTIYRYASAAAILTAIALGWFYNSKVSVTTAFGEHSLVKLPDGSTIRLNANSTLSYWRAWQWHRERETWLEGEGLFEVVHLNSNPSAITDRERFVLHTGKLNIEVLGTTFNVKYRRNKFLVALFRGSVRVSEQNGIAKQLTLKPGELIRYEHQGFAKEAITAQTNKPLAWTNRSMDTRGIAVEEIIENFEDTYGGRIVLDNPALLNKRIDGFISLSTPESTLYMLANLLNSTIDHRDSTYYFHSKTPTTKP